MSSRNSNPPFPFVCLLALIFITLKLCNVIQWSWWLVLSPIWGTFALAVIVLIIVVAIKAYQEVRDGR